MKRCSGAGRQRAPGAGRILPGAGSASGVTTPWWIIAEWAVPEEPAMAAPGSVTMVAMRVAAMVALGAVPEVAMRVVTRVALGAVPEVVKRVAMRDVTGLNCAPVSSMGVLSMLGLLMLGLLMLVRDRLRPLLGLRRPPQAPWWFIAEWAVPGAAPWWSPVTLPKSGKTPEAAQLL